MVGFCNEILIGGIQANEKREATTSHIINNQTEVWGKGGKVSLLGPPATWWGPQQMVAFQYLLGPWWLCIEGLPWHTLLRWPRHAGRPRWRWRRWCSPSVWPTLTVPGRCLCCDPLRSWGLLSSDVSLDPVHLCLCSTLLVFRRSIRVFLFQHSPLGPPLALPVNKSVT